MILHIICVVRAFEQFFTAFHRASQQSTLFRNFQQKF
jgi:hypothetical protein